MTDKDDELFTAYRATEFWVDDAPGESFCFQCGELSAAVDRLLKGNQVAQWAYITACNPGSTPLSGAENSQRMRQLEERVRELGFKTYHGNGIGTIGNWLPEPSLLVLGIDEPHAIQLARQFGQAAILVGRLGEPARLIHTG